MDERTIESSQRATQLFEDQARASMNGTKTYAVIVLGRNDGQPFTVEAANADERQRKLTEAGVNVLTDKWAAGYIDAKRQMQICGNNDVAKTQVRQYLRKR